MKKILLLFSCSFLVLSSLSQTQVSIHCTVSPPYSPNLHEYTNFLSQTTISVTNNTAQSHRLRFIFTVTNLSNGMYFKTKDDIPVQAYILNPSLTQTISGHEAKQLASTDVYDYHTNADEATLKSIAISSILPEGNYQLCIQAVDFDNTSTLLSDAVGGCTIFPITFIQPPVIIQPMCNNTVPAMDPQNLTFNWMPSTGNISGAIINYDLYMTLVPDGINPQDAMTGAVQAGVGLFVFHQPQITGNQFIYGTMYPPLDSGTYAVQLVASNPAGTLVFANEGKSQVCSFVYKKNTGITIPPPPVIVPPSGISCESCKANVPTDPVNSAGPASGSTMQFGNQQIKVLTVNTSAGKSSGTGILHFLQVPIRVAFADVTVNSSNVVMSGQAAAIQKSGIDLMPTTTAPGMGPVSLSPTQVANLGNFISSSSSQLVSALKGSADAAGFELPLGIDKNILGLKTVIAITGLHLTPSSSAFDAATLVEMPDMGTRIALSVKNMCMKDNGVCGDGVLYLAQDIKLPVMTLKGASYPADSGTFVQFKDDGFEKLRVKAEYEFPVSLISSKAIPNQIVKAVIVGEGKSWSDWMASVNFEPFVVKGVEDLSFALDGAAIYDHSSLSNPVGVPASLVTSATWNGFYMPKLKMSLPSVIKSISNTDAVSASVTDLIIDDQGVSGSINVNNILSIGNGSLDSWYYSIDRIYATFEKNSFKDAGMDGKLILPVSDNKEQNQLNYHCTLSSSMGKIGFQFVIQPKDNIEVPIWYSQFTLFNTSNITVEYVSDELKATADLNGKMDIIINNVAGVGLNVKFKLMEVEHLKLTTYSPYVSVSSFTAGLASPQKDMDGFHVALKKLSFITESTPDGILIGPHFEIAMTLSSIDAAPSATLGMNILGKPDIKNKRPFWEFKKCDPTKIAVSGKLGPAEVKGSLEFVKNDPKWHDYMKGTLGVAVANLLSVDCQAMFGNKVTATENYNYFYVDANVSLMPTGVPLSVLPAPPISAFGMGMGLFYHLSTPPLTSNPMDLLSADGQNLTNKYEPNPNTAGFNGNVILGTSDNTTFMGKCGIEAIVNISGNNFGLEKLSFRGDFHLMCEPGNMTNSIGTGVGVIEFDFANKIFDLQAAMEIKAKLGPVVLEKIQATLDFRIAATSNSTFDWHLKMGEPKRPCTMNPFNVFPFPYNMLITANGYFMTGNDIPPGIALNEKVANHFPTILDQKRATPDLEKGEAIVFGAGLSLPSVDETFLCFYLKFDGGIGFDIKFDRLTTECKGVDGKPGFNGYYANGHFYAYFDFEAGLDVDLWFYHGRVSAVSSWIAASFNAGIPNPTWFEGKIAAHYDVLDGIISGDMNFELSIGAEKKCKAATHTFGNGLPIISEIKPGDMNSKNGTFAPGIEIDQPVAVGFNYPVEKEFTISDADENGVVQSRRFLLKIDYFNVVENPNGSNTLLFSSASLKDIDKSWDSKNKSLTLFPPKSFNPDKEHKIEIKVTAYETTGGIEKICKETSDASSPDVIEVKEALFKTAGCPQTLVGKVLGSYPNRGQKFLLQDENERKGHLILPTDYTCMNLDAKYDLKARFTVYKDRKQVGTPQEVDAAVSGQFLNFQIPPLPNQAFVQITVFKERKASKNLNLGIVDNSQRITATYIDKNQISDFGNTVLMKKTSVEIKSIPQEIELYSYCFMTSKFNSINDKLAGLSGTAQTFAVHNNNCLEDMEMKIPSGEAFDIFELNGQRYDANLYDYGARKNYCIPAIVDIREADSDVGWRGNFVKPYFKKYFDVEWSSIVNLKNFDYSHYYGTNKFDCFLNPIQFSIDPLPETPLTQSEIDMMLPEPPEISAFAIIKNY